MKNPDKKILKETKNSLYNMIVGKFIGEGISRKVYQHNVDESLVVKIQYSRYEHINHQQNYNEWVIWSIVKDLGDEYSKWFVPCVNISNDYNILIQKKTEPVQSYIEQLNEIPEFLEDVHANNFGVLNGKIVCHDYGYLNLHKLLKNNLLTKNKLKKINRKEEIEYE